MKHLSIATVAITIAFATGCGSSAVKQSRAPQQAAQAPAPVQVASLPSQYQSYLQAPPGQMEMNWQPTAAPEKKSLVPESRAIPDRQKKRRALFALPVTREQ
jgi:hypothetical protein